MAQRDGLSVAVNGNLFQPRISAPMSLSDFPGKTRKVPPDVFSTFIHDYGGTPALSLQILNPRTIGRSLSLNIDLFIY